MTQTHLHHSSRRRPTPTLTHHLMARSSLGKSSASTRAGGGAAASASSSSNEEKPAHASIAGGNAVVVVSRKGCCMSHVATRLLCSLGVNPRVVELHPEEKQQLLVAGEAEEDEVMPAIFIGGRLLGGVDSLLSAHISGSLVPQLKEAGALWL